MPSESQPVAVRCTLLAQYHNAHLLYKCTRTRTHTHTLQVFFVLMETRTEYQNVSLSGLWVPTKL
jgi:hypothetical protein